MGRLVEDSAERRGACDLYLLSMVLYEIEFSTAKSTEPQRKPNMVSLDAFFSVRVFAMAPRATQRLSNEGTRRGALPGARRGGVSVLGVNDVLQSH